MANPQPNPAIITLPPNSTGTNVDCVQFTVAAQLVTRQNIEVATPIAIPPLRQAFGPETVGSNSTGAAFACSAIAAGLTGYLSKVKLVSTGECLWTIMSGSTILGYAMSGAGNAGSSDIYEPPHRFFDQCVAAQAFSMVPTNLTSSSITVYATAWFDQF